MPFDRSKYMLGNKRGFSKGYTPWNKGVHIRSVNRSYFKTWSPNMAYILGYIASDGCLHSHDTGISIVSKDKDILDTISDELESTYCVGPHSANAYHIQIYSSEIYADLIALGLTPRKSLTLKHPSVPSEYLPHFIRGIFDGDGCVSRVVQRKKVTLWTSISSASSGFIRLMWHNLTELGLQGGHIYAHKATTCNSKTTTCYELCFRKYDSLKLYDLMYASASIFLQRKRNVFDSTIKEMM